MNVLGGRCRAQLRCWVEKSAGEVGNVWRGAPSSGDDRAAEVERSADPLDRRARERDFPGRIAAQLPLCNLPGGARGARAKPARDSEYPIERVGFRNGRFGGAGGALCPADPLEGRPRYWNLRLWSLASAWVSGPTSAARLARETAHHSCVEIEKGARIAGKCVKFR